MKILYNANLITLDPYQPHAEALVVDGPEILAVGKTRDLLSRYKDHSVGPVETEDLQGHTILPGLIDAHLHLQYYSLGLKKIDCETETKEECLQRVIERVQSTSPGQWVLGHGWNQNRWAGGFGTAPDLDQAAPRNPVFLTAKSLHAAWANSQALMLAGIGANTPDPEGGKIGRDDSGQPNGILFESAMALVEGKLPEPTVSQVAEAILEAQPVLWRMGLTGVHDFDRTRCFEALQSLHQAGDLLLRVVKSIPLELLPEAAALGLHSGFGDEFLRIGSIKAFADGALGPQTAAMLQPYEGSSQNTGMLLLDSEELFEHGRLAVEHGLSLAVHAIGDRANHEVLEAFRQLRDFEAQQGLPAQRHRIEHVQVLHPEDVDRLAQLGVIASMQPIHATSDMEMADRYWGKRSVLSYAWRSQLKNGASLAFGSDAPVESPNPFWGLHAAVTRQRADGSPGPDGWYPEQRLSLSEALQGFTTGAAYAAGMEDRQGRLSPGYLADLIVLLEDPFRLKPRELRELESQATMVAGEWVYRAF